MFEVELLDPILMQLEGVVPPVLVRFEEALEEAPCGLVGVRFHQALAATVFRFVPASQVAKN